MGIPRGANVFLALGLAVVTYLLLKRMRDEKAACIGSLLMLFTPVSLIMLHRSYMAMFGASAFLAIGGGLYLYYCLEQRSLKPWIAGVLLLLWRNVLLIALASSLLGWKRPTAVFSRQTRS